MSNRDIIKRLERVIKYLKDAKKQGINYHIVPEVSRIVFLEEDIRLEKLKIDEDESAPEEDHTGQIKNSITGEWSFL
jgi:hypothetical protein